MRNLKTITTQDHILVIIATEGVGSEITCTTTEDGKRVFPAPFTSFHMVGSVKTFVTDEDGNWNFHRNGVTPIIMFRIQDMESGTAAETDEVLVMSIMPKDPEYLKNWERSLLSEEQRGAVMSASRDSVAEIVDTKNIRKMDTDTFEEIEETVDDEIVFE